MSSVCGRSGTPPAVRNGRLVPRRDGVVQRGEGVIRVNTGNDTAPGYVNRVSRSGLSGYMPAAAAAGSFLYIGVLQQSCRPAYGSPSRFSGVNVLGASAPPVISTCRVNPPVRRGLGMSRSAPPNAYPKGCTACTASCSSEARTIERSLESPLVSARIAVNLAAPSVPREQRNVLSPNG